MSCHADPVYFIIYSVQLIYLFDSTYQMHKNVFSVRFKPFECATNTLPSITDNTGHVPAWHACLLAELENYDQIDDQLGMVQVYFP